MPLHIRMSPRGEESFEMRLYLSSEDPHHYWARTGIDKDILPCIPNPFLGGRSAEHEEIEGAPGKPSLGSIAGTVLRQGIAVFG